MGTFNMEAPSMVSTVYCDASFGGLVDGLSLGGSLKLKPNEESMVNDYNVGMQYSRNKDETYSLSTSNRMEGMKLSMWKRLSSKTELGFRYQAKVKELTSPDLEFGGRLQLDNKSAVQGLFKGNGSG